MTALRQTGRRVYAINPMAVARYRERHSVARKKSDHVDAMTLANILRTDAHVHRPLPADSELVRAVAVLARATQDATWRRTRAVQELRAVLREYYPGFLTAFKKGTATNLASSEARAVLALAPTPTAAARLTKAQLMAVLRRAGRQSRVESLALQLHQALRAEQLHQPPLVEEAFALLGSVDAECARGSAHRGHYRGVPAAPRLRGDHQFPGLADLSGARVLGKIGDDRERFTDARSLKAYADYAGLRAQHLDHPPRGEEQPTQRSGIPLGVRRDSESRRTPRSLSPTTRPR